jgi:hypothetical protein
MTAIFNQAVQAHQSGKLSEAESLYRQIIAQDPKNFDALHMLGIVCSSTGPDSFQANDRSRPISSDRLPRQQLGLPAEAFVSCCFNNNYKIAGLDM